MWYWYEESGFLDRELLETKRILKMYEDVTGIQAANEKDLRNAYEIKQSVCKECVPALEKANNDVILYKGRSERRAKAIVISVPAALAIGLGLGLILN